MCNHVSHGQGVLSHNKSTKKHFPHKNFSCLFVAFLRVINGFLGILVLRIGNCKTKVAKVLSSLMDIREVVCGSGGGRLQEDEAILSAVFIIFVA